MLCIKVVVWRNGLVALGEVVDFNFLETPERLVSLSALMYYMLGSGTKYGD